MSEDKAELNIREEFKRTGGWKRGRLGGVAADEQYRKLVRTTGKDLVTGLDNEYPLADMLHGLQDRWTKNYRYGENLRGTFVVADLDGLHAANHDYGKLSGGNYYLDAAAKCLKAESRGRGRCFREGKGADELLMYFPGFKTEEELRAYLDEIDRNLEVLEREAQDKYPGIKFGLSYSVASFDKEFSPKEAYRLANDAMGKAKRSKTGERVGNVGRIFAREFPEWSKTHE